MVTPSIASVVAYVPPQPMPARQAWPDRPQATAEERYQRDYRAAQEGQALGDMSFDRSSIRVTREDSEPITLGELRKSGNPVERIDEGSRQAPQGKNDVVTASSLVQQMIGSAGVQSVTPPIRRARAGGGSGGARKSRAKGASA